MLKPFIFTCKIDKRSGHLFRVDTRNHQQLLKPMGFEYKKRQTEWACFQNRYNKSSTVVKTNCFCSKSIKRNCFFKTDTINHQQLLKPIGLTCKNNTRSGHVCKQIWTRPARTRQASQPSQPSQASQPGQPGQPGQARPGRAGWPIR